MNLFQKVLFRIFVSVLVIICMDLVAQEVHPCLLIGPEDISELAERLGENTLGSTVFNQAFEGCLRGERAEEAVGWLMDWVEHVEETGNYTDDDPFRWNPDYAFVCDFQWHYMTSSEQSRARTALINTSKDMYNTSITEYSWYFLDEHINNWAIGHMTDYYLQRILYPALMFSGDASSEASVNRAIEILCNWWDRCPGIINGGDADMIDETLNSPNGYGLWDLAGFSVIIEILSRNTSFDPYSYAGGLFYNELVYRTYILDYKEDDSDIHTFFSKASYVGAGHGENLPIVYYHNEDILQFAYVYNDPVLAWHYYANPSPCEDGGFEDFLDDWDEIPPPIGWSNWHSFLYWGKVAPVFPEIAGWSLNKFFEGAGVAVMRKSWDKKDGLIWFRAGYGGSHYQPCQGTVIYHADTSVVLGHGGGQNYSSDSRMNNVLLVDGEGQISPYPSLPAQRRAYGTMERLNDYTYEARLDSAYTELSYGVSWIRRVHYDAELDILEINDSVVTTDGNEHELAFNWVTEPEILGTDWIQLPAGYLMLIDSRNSFSTEEVRVQPSSEEEAFNTLLVSSQGESINISWYIGKDEDDLLEYLDEGGYHPFNFYLYPNYPDPFNLTTVIRYFVSGEGDVRISIYDLLGREVTVVFEGHVTTGTGEIDWDGTNSEGEKVQSGTYICRMTGETGGDDSEKIIFIK
jgi:hypothetical protein